MTRTTRAASALLTMLAMVAAGCGDKKVTVNVDVASFIDASDRTGTYQAPPMSPPIEFDLVPIRVNLLEGLDSFSVAEEMGMDVAVEFENRTGEGRARFTVYFSDQEQNVFATDPVTALEADLVPGTMTTGTSHFEADARVLDLFRQQQVWMGLKLAWTPSSQAALDGDYLITQIDARVVSSVQIF